MTTSADVDAPDLAPAGTEAPASLPPSDGPQTVWRGFAFCDLSGFTAYVASHGNREGVRVLAEFRDTTREIAGRRGVRIAKWLGDGVMLVGDAGPLVATVAELVGRLGDADLPLRSGLAAGECLLFEGDDYIGTTVNLAARLSDEAGPGEILANSHVAEFAPDWVRVGRAGTRRIRGIGKVRRVRSLSLGTGIDLPDLGPSPLV